MPTIAIAGGHGSIALLLTRLLSDRGTAVRSLVRNPDHEADIRALGGTMTLVDLEDASAEELARSLADCDAVVFAAGAGPGSGAARKETVDYGGAVKLKDACGVADVNRYVMISAMGTDDPPDGDDVFDVYLQAKARADAELMDSDLAWTIVRPGRLTDDPPTGRVAVRRHVDRGEIARGDVAEVIAQVLEREDMAGQMFEVVAGESSIADALDRLVAAS